MSAMTDAGRRGLALIERLLDALADPARRERTAAMALLGYVAVWTLYAALAKGSQDIHVDMSEQYVLSRGLASGYAKHPPLAMWVVRAWFAVFPTADWAYYLLAMANAGLALWITWRLYRRFLDGEKRVVGLALLTLVPFFNFHALKFNVEHHPHAVVGGDHALVPALVRDAAHCSMRRWRARSRRWRCTANTGRSSCCSGSALPRSPIRRRAAYFRSGAPWVTIAVGAAALAPHVAWLVANDFCAVLLCRRQRTARLVRVHACAPRWAISAAASPMSRLRS